MIEQEHCFLIVCFNKWDKHYFGFIKKSRMVNTRLVKVQKTIIIFVALICAYNYSNGQITLSEKPGFKTMMLLDSFSKYEGQIQLWKQGQLEDMYRWEGVKPTAFGFQPNKIFLTFRDDVLINIDIYFSNRNYGNKDKPYSTSACMEDANRLAGEFQMIYGKPNVLSMPEYAHYSWGHADYVAIVQSRNLLLSDQGGCAPHISLGYLGSISSDW